MAARRPVLARLTTRLSTMSPASRAGFAAFSGAVAATAHAPFDIALNLVLGLFLGFLMAASAAGPRAGFFTGWAFGTGYFAVTLHWIVEPFLVDVARHGWMAPFALVLLAGGLALFWGAAFALARALGPTPARLALAWPAAMGLAELARGHVLSGFPWALPAYGWAETPALQLSAWTGPYGLTLLTLAAVAAVALALARLAHPGWLALLVLPWAAFVAGGAALMPPPAPSAESRPVVRLVQPNAAQHLKWRREMIPVFFERQESFTAAPPAAGAPTPALVVWPETAIPWLLDDAGPVLARISAAAGGTPVVLGLQRREGARAFNALALVGQGGAVQAVYDKYRLVPFGEYVPLGGLARLLGLRSFAARDGYGYSPGPGPALLELGPLGRALPLICYEAIFPGLVGRAPERPDLILHLTNDAWFGEIAGPQQHLAQARARAVEQGLPVIRAANTGISAAIDAAGRVTGALPLGQAGFLDVALPPPGPPTLYARTGEWPVLAALAAAFGLLLARRGGPAGPAGRRNRD